LSQEQLLPAGFEFHTYFTQKSFRIEMKKFQDLKGPLAMLKIKMTMKAQTSTEYTIFAEEIASIINEQDKFIVALEWLVATAEATDPVQ